MKCTRQLGVHCFFIHYNRNLHETKPNKIIAARIPQIKAQHKEAHDSAIDDAVVVMTHGHGANTLSRRAVTVIDQSATGSGGAVRDRHGSRSIE